MRSARVFLLQVLSYADFTIYSIVKPFMARRGNVTLKRYVTYVLNIILIYNIYNLSLIYYTYLLAY